MAMSRARRAELQRRAQEIRRACQRRGLGVEQTAEAIHGELPEVSPLEAWRLAYGWSRQQALDGLLGLYRDEGLAEPGVNTAMLCRWEHGTVQVTYAYARMLSKLYKAPAARLGLPYGGWEPAACTPASCPTRRPTVGQGDPEETDPMRRRTLLAAGASIPLGLLQRLDDALAAPPDPGSPEGLPQIRQRLRDARRQYDISALASLVAGLPAMLAAAKDTAERIDTPAGWALLSACYNLTTDTLNKVDAPSSARLTADRAMLFAERSGDAVAIAASARPLGMMLRKEQRFAPAAAVVARAAGRLEATGLRHPAQAAMYVRLLCAGAYTASWSGDRDRALERIGEAEDAVTRLSLGGPVMALPFVRLYRANIHFALGDAGSAVHAARDLRPEMYPTPERRARLHTDMARAWWMWGKPEETAHALLCAYREAPGEVRDRPTYRRIAVALTTRHPRISGVQELATVL
ncbi:hypothetical protein [Sphaerisporangium aureirubrum]|uniref:XRE family transcriptional regulator n=1 Tax=Sphaerisporangium aureirubrum TaxID=1544736 RepID=A0ABW1NCE0_9ACTN